MKTLIQDESIDYIIVFDYYSGGATLILMIGYTTHNVSFLIHAVMSMGQFVPSQKSKPSMQITL